MTMPTRPNDNVAFEGINRHFTSYTGYSLTSSHLNLAVTNVASKAVGLGSDGDDLTGKLMHLDEDGMMSTIQDEGYVDLPYSGTTPAINDRVCVDGVGGVRTTSVGHTGGRPKIVDISTFATDGIVSILME